MARKTPTPKRDLPPAYHAIHIERGDLKGWIVRYNTERQTLRTDGTWAPTRDGLSEDNLFESKAAAVKAAKAAI